MFTEQQKINRMMCFFSEPKERDKLYETKACPIFVSLLSLSHSTVVCPELGQYWLRVAEVTQSPNRDAVFNQLTGLSFIHSLVRLITSRLQSRRATAFCADIDNSFSARTFDSTFFYAIH